MEDLSPLSRLVSIRFFLSIHFSDSPPRFLNFIAAGDPDVLIVEMLRASIEQLVAVSPNPFIVQFHGLWNLQNDLQIVISVDDLTRPHIVVADHRVRDINQSEAVLAILTVQGSAL